MVEFIIYNDSYTFNFMTKHYAIDAEKLMINHGMELGTLLSDKPTANPKSWTLVKAFVAWRNEPPLESLECM